MLNVVMLIVFMLNVVMLSVMTPLWPRKKYCAKVEVTENDKQSSLLQHRINYGYKNIADQLSGIQKMFFEILR